MAGSLSKCAAAHRRDSDAWYGPSILDVWRRDGAHAALQPSHEQRRRYFVPDPQYLGYVNLRISEAAENITTDYEEHAGFVKLILRDGEIDFVVSRNLTAPGYDEWTLMGRLVKVETAAEIVAKKMWHRGDRPTARDLFDLSLVIEREPASLMAAGKFLIRHRETFLRLLRDHREPLMRRFNDIRTLGYTPTFDYCAKLADEFLRQIPDSD
jgi:hypothetical protein